MTSPVSRRDGTSVRAPAAYCRSPGAHQTAAARKGAKELDKPLEHQADSSSHNLPPELWKEKKKPEGWQTGRRQACREKTFVAFRRSFYIVITLRIIMRCKVYWPLVNFRFTKLEQFSNCFF